MKQSRRKYRIFYRLEENLEIPMFLLSIFWLYLFIVEMVEGLGPTQETMIYIIWLLFIVEFLIKLIVAPRKLSFIRNSWITIIALVIPAFRMLRLFNALRILRSVRVLNSTKIIRALTSGKRFFSALKEAQGPQPVPEMNVGILIAYGKTESKDELTTYARQLIRDVKGELDDSTGIPWIFDLTESHKLDNDNSRLPSDFLDSASQSMAEGPYDLVTVVTDVGLMSRKNQIVPGLSSSVSRIVVISTRKLIATGRNQHILTFDHPRVKKNGAALFLHLVGHILGLRHTSAIKSKVMGMEEFDRDLKEIPAYSADEKLILQQRALKAPDRELLGGNDLEAFIFHVLMTLRHPRNFLKPLLQNGAILLPLSLPGLATAAVAPAIILIFNAEIWDVALGMTNFTATFFAVISIMLASFYLVRVQSLFLPRKEKRVLTEHLAVANSVIYFSIFLACIGLFLLVGGLAMIIIIYVFPPDLMQAWPTLNRPEIMLGDKIRLAVFISTIGVTTGALAGGLESRAVIQRLALFRKDT